MLSFITKNWSLKLLALIIALVMWLFVAGQETSEVTVEVPVELNNIPPHSVVAGDVASKIQVRVAGPSSLIRRVATMRLVKEVDLAKVGLGGHVYRLLPRELGLPPGVHVVRVSPAEFTVTLAKKVDRKVPVSVKIKGKPAEGYEVSEVLTNPPKVSLKGTEKELEAIDWVFTLPVDVTGLKKDIKGKAGLKLPSGRSLQLSQPEVEVLVKIKLKGAKPGKAEKIDKGKGEAAKGASSQVLPPSP